MRLHRISRIDQMRLRLHHRNLNRDDGHNGLIPWNRWNSCWSGSMNDWMVGGFDGQRFYWGWNTSHAKLIITALDK